MWLCNILILQHPHEAFGLVFNFDGVIADLATIRREAWVTLAAQLNQPLPAHILHHPELQLMPPEVAVVRLLRWATDRKTAIDLAMQHAELAGKLLTTHNRWVVMQWTSAGHRLAHAGRCTHGC